MLQFVLVYMFINVAAYTVAICTIATFSDAAACMYNCLCIFLCCCLNKSDHILINLFLLYQESMSPVHYHSSKSFTLSTALTVRKHVTLHTSKNISVSYIFTFVVHLKIFIYVYIEYCFLYYCYLSYSDLFCSSLCSF